MYEKFKDGYNPKGAPAATKLVMFSGGYDSTYMVLKMFEENKKPYDMILIHLILKDKNERWEYENDSCLQMVDELYKMGYEFRYYPITVDLGMKFSPTWDSIYTTQFAAAYCYKHRNIKEVYLGFILEDLEEQREYSYQEILSAPWRQNTKRSIDEAPKCVFPLRYKPKKEILTELKENYKNFYGSAFTCRHPLENGKACGSCKSCVKFYKAEK